jgi:hypothetical protein
MEGAVMGDRVLFIGWGTPVRGRPPVSLNLQFTQMLSIAG